MNRPTALCALLCLLISTQDAYGAGAALKGIKRVGVIAIAGKDKESKIGVESETVKFKVETLLRKAGMSVRDYKEGMPLVCVSCDYNYFKAHQSIVCFHVTIEVKELCTLKRNGEDVFATTYNDTFVSLASKDDLESQVLNVVEKRLDSLVSVWLLENDTDK
jgi:hypothetical protein